MSEAKPMTMYKTPKQTLLVVMKAGVAKGVALWWQLLALGFHAGMFLGFGCALVIAIVGALDSTSSTGIKKLISGTVFPVCLILVVISGAELFTGNVMYMLSARMAGQTTWKALAKNWFCSYFGNLCGALFVAYFLFHLSDLFNTPYYDAYLRNLAHSKTSYGFGEMVLRGVGCNYFVCIALWCSAASDDILSKIFSIWWPIMAFVCIGFEHSIANMFYVPMAIMNDTAGDVTASVFIVKNLIPVTIGNILGGGMFAFIQYLIYHPYISADVELMQLRQGRTHSGRNEFDPKKVANGKKHYIPDYSNTMFSDLAHSLWVRYCEFMQKEVGIVVYTSRPNSPTLEEGKVEEVGIGNNNSVDTTKSAMTTATVTSPPADEKV